jgi:hypothetical protein
MVEMVAMVELVELVGLVAIVATIAMIAMVAKISCNQNKVIRNTNNIRLSMCYFIAARWER